MFSRFFIDRPIFANVIAIITILIGLVSLWRLPIEQYPEITPPTVRVTAQLSRRQRRGRRQHGRRADRAAGQRRARTCCTCRRPRRATARYSLTITFEIGTNLDTAQVLVQNRVAIAEPLLPEEVRRQGVTVKKQSTNIILVVSLHVAGRHVRRPVPVELRHAAAPRRAEPRARASATCTVFGTANYSMRVWLDPEKLKARGLTTQDVVAAIREQNVQVAAGQVGQPPIAANDDQAFQYTVTTLGRLSDAEQFENIVVKTGDGSRITRLKDVARVELGAQTYDQFNLQARACRPPTSASSSCRAATRWKWPTRSCSDDGAAEQVVSRRAWSTSSRSTRRSSSRRRSTRSTRRCSKPACWC